MAKSKKKSSVRHKPLPQLDRECLICINGEEHNGSVCCACNGTGFAPTELGHHFLRFLERHNARSK